MWFITIMCPAGKAGGVFMHQRDPIWISSSVVSNWTWCSVIPNYPALIITWEVMSQETGLSDTLTFPLLKSTRSQMSLIITWQLRVPSSSAHGVNVRHTVLPLAILSREERLSHCSPSKKGKDQVHGCGSDYLFFPWSFWTDSCSHASLVGR